MSPANNYQLFCNLFFFYKLSESILNLPASATTINDFAEKKKDLRKSFETHSKSYLQAVQSEQVRAKKQDELTLNVLFNVIVTVAEQFFFQIAEWKTLLLLCDQFFIARCVCCVNVGGKKACGKITNTSSIITLCLGEAKNNIKLPRSEYFYGRSSWRSHYLFMGSENWLFLDA